jgi:hypothetical protein
MRPTLRPGDRLLTIRWPWLRPGHVVAVDVDGRTVVKRIATIDAHTVSVEGDNRAATTDYAEVPRRAVQGRAVYRYAPADRAGRLH